VRKLAQVKSGVFFQRYQQYAEQAGERWLSVKELPHEMHRRGFEHKRITDGVRVYLGLEFYASSAPHWTTE
jgi:hypothetical protein